MTGLSSEAYHEKVQCLRVKFSRGDNVKYVSHLGLMRLWERLLRRAEIPLGYSEGFNPHPRISLAAPLPIGVTSESELMDVFLQKYIAPYTFLRNIERQLPEGVEILEVQQIPSGQPSLQSQLRYAEYRVEVEASKNFEEIQTAIITLLRTDSIPWQHMRDTGPRNYDLRPLIDHLWIIGWYDSTFALGMRLRCDSRGSGRPEQVTQALGFEKYPGSICRTKLLFA